jgi:hypothetical protein
VTQEEKDLTIFFLINKLVLQMKRYNTLILRDFQNGKRYIFCLYARFKITLKCKPKMFFSFEFQLTLHCHSRVNAKQSIKELCQQYSFIFVIGYSKTKTTTFLEQENA